MLLAIDVGNSSCAVALCDEKQLKILQRWRLEGRAERTSDEYGAWLHSMFVLHGFSLRRVSAVLLACVVPRAIAPLSEMCRKYLHQELRVVKREDVPITLQLNAPDEAGIDRVVNAFAVGKNFSVPALVVDFGTATTFDAVDEQGCYIGGVIAPGIELSRDSLVSRTAQLPYVTIDFCSEVLGKDTLSAMRAGLFWGWVSMVDGLCARLMRAMNAPQACIVATGGACRLISQSSTKIEHVEEDLTIQGLIHLHRVLSLSPCAS